MQKRKYRNMENILLRVRDNAMYIAIQLQWNLLIRTLENVDTCIIQTPSCGPK